MRRGILRVLGVACAVCPAIVLAQSRPATYITDEEVKKVNAQPGVDRTIRVVDDGNEHFSVGIIHRGASAAAGRGAAGGGGAAAGGARGAAAQGEPCGEAAATPPAGATPGGIAHDSQTEGYYIVSGGGTLVTGGHIVNGRKTAADSQVTKELNGPSCGGMIAGADVVKKVVKAGDIIIIPARTPHGWTDIGDHVDYLSFRPSDHVLEAGYVHPSIKK
jgi:mannose-6-phosphate isomerase-like protein (cupin superfamily)